jgi:hypothetical protein
MAWSACPSAARSPAACASSSSRLASPTSCAQSRAGRLLGARGPGADPPLLGGRAGDLAGLLDVKHLLPCQRGVARVAALPARLRRAAALHTTARRLPPLRRPRTVAHRGSLKDDSEGGGRGEEAGRGGAPARRCGATRSARSLPGRLRRAEGRGAQPHARPLGGSGHRVAPRRRRGMRTWGAGSGGGVRGAPEAARRAALVAGLHQLDAAITDRHAPGRLSQRTLGVRVVAWPCHFVLCRRRRDKHRDGCQRPEPRPPRGPVTAPLARHDGPTAAESKELDQNAQKGRVGHQRKAHPQKREPLDPP